MYFLGERRISGNYWMIAFSLQTQSNATVVINPTGLRGRPRLLSAWDAGICDWFQDIHCTHVRLMGRWNGAPCKDNNPFGTQKTVSQNLEDE